jgi:hypothetical protein
VGWVGGKVGCLGGGGTASDRWPGGGRWDWRDESSDEEKKQRRCQSSDTSEEQRSTRGTGRMLSLSCDRCRL